MSCLQATAGYCYLRDDGSCLACDPPPKTFPRRGKSIPRGVPTLPTLPSLRVAFPQGMSRYQQWMVAEGRKPGIQMPETIQTGEQWMEWLRSLRRDDIPDDK